MKFRLKIILLIGVMIMVNCYGCSDKIRYEKYTSKDPELNITVDYISGWLYTEQRGSYGSYAQVVFYEPETKDEYFKAQIVVTIKSSSRVKFKPPTIDAALDDLVSKRLKFKEAMELSRAKIKLLKTDAWDVEFSYKTLDKPYSPDANLIPVRERIIIFNKDEKFYFLRYENTDKEFDKFKNAFYHLARTLRLKNSR